MKIRVDDLTHPEVLALLASHLEHMQQNSPEDSSFALDVSGLKAPGVTFWTVWNERALMGCGAMKELSPTHGEIKSMRTHENHTRKGVAARMLEHIIKQARDRGYQTLSLETGTGPAFEPALALYRKYGFKKGDAFADYRPGPFNQFFHLDL